MRKFIPRSAMPKNGDTGRIFYCNGPGCARSGYNVVFFDAPENQIAVLCFSCVDRYQSWLTEKVNEEGGRVKLADLVARFCEHGPKRVAFSLADIR